jgi:hypothetical protein
MTMWGGGRGRELVHPKSIDTYCMYTYVQYKIHSSFRAGGGRMMEIEERGRRSGVLKKESGENKEWMAGTEDVWWGREGGEREQDGKGEQGGLV